MDTVIEECQILPFTGSRRIPDRFVTSPARGGGDFLACREVLGRDGGRVEAPRGANSVIGQVEHVREPKFHCEKFARHQMAHLDAGTVGPPRQLSQSRCRLESEVYSPEFAGDVKSTGLRRPRRRGNRLRQVGMRGPGVSVRQPAEGNPFRQVAIPEFNA